MPALVLTAEQRKDLDRRRKKTLDRWIYQRLTAVLMVADDHSLDETAHFLGADLVQLNHWLCVFRSEGLEGLCSLADEQTPPTNQ
jgi:hypothetical protein